jgi:predicted ribosome quality control (RQC) complex YloA/Tae2 family protein
MDRRLVVALEGPAGGPLAIQLELWPPGNVIAEVPGVRVLWCARARPASTHRAALAPGAVYAAPARTDVVDPSALDATQLEAWLGALPAERWPAALSRHVAGLPKGLLDALVPTLPRAVLDGARDFAALADALHAWARETYDGEGRVWGAAWDAPSPGATLVTRALEAEGPAVRVTGPFARWDEAAAALGRALPEPVDADALTAARAEVKRLVRAEAAVRSDLENAGDAASARADADALAAFLPRVVRGAASVDLPDPSDPMRTRTIALDATKKPHENLDRLYKRAGKLERTLEQAPARLAAVRAELEKAREKLEAFERGDEGAGASGRDRSPATDRAKAPANAARPRQASVSSALEPRRYKTREGWEVLIGKNNQGNDHLTHRMARPEDVWMHVHGAAGSHVVIRRGKGPNEPSKATLQEVAAWAAFYSQARNAGTVPVTVTQKKYVRKPRKAPAGLAQVERSKTVFAKPAEPPADARVNEDEP